MSDVLEAQQPRIFLWLPVFFGCGITLYFSWPGEPERWLILSALALGAILILLACFGSRGFRALSLLVLFALLGFVDADWRARTVAAPVLAEPFRGAVEGTVRGISRSASNAARVTLSDVTLAGVPERKTPARVRVTLLGWIAPDVLVAGQRITTTANLSPPGAPVEPGGFDFRRFAWFKKLGAVGYTRNPALVAAPMVSPGPSGWIFARRMNVADAIREHVPGQKGAFAAAILTGDRSAIDPDVTATLRASNLAHLLAISGLHMGLLTGFVFTLVRYGLALFPAIALRFKTKKIGAVAALIAGFLYLLLSGGNVATQRAFVMASVVLVAVLLDRPAFTLRSVALAALLILLWRPESLTSAGFQMSFAATTALVAAFEWLRGNAWWRDTTRSKLRYLRPVLMLAISSSVAGAATAPLSAFHFNQIVPYGLLANLTAVPLMGLIVMPSAVLAFLLWPFGLEGIAFSVMGQGIAAILEIAERVSSLPGAVRKIPSGGPLTLPLLTLGSLFFLLWVGRARVAGLAIVAAGFLNWNATIRPEVLISDGGRLVGVSTELGRVLSRKRGEGFTALSWLEGDGDAATQAEAWGRMTPTGAKGVQDFDLSNGWRLLVISEKAEAGLGKRSCGDRTILLMAKAKIPETAPCLFIGNDQVRKLGAMSLQITPQGVVLRGARRPERPRLWTATAQ